MAISKQAASTLVAEFLAEFPSAKNLTFVLLADDNDFHEHFGTEHAKQALKQWGCAVGGFLPTRNVVAIACQYAIDADDVRKVLYHEAIGHSGSLTLSDAEKRACLDAIVRARHEPSLRVWWAAIDEAYPSRSELEKAEEVYCRACEEIGRIGYVANAYEHAWNQSVLIRSEPLQAWGLVQIAEHVAQGYRANARPQQIFPASDFDLFNGPAAPAGGQPLSLVPTLGGGALLKSSVARDLVPTKAQQLDSQLAKRPRM